MTGNEKRWGSEWFETRHSFIQSWSARSERA